MIRHFERHDAEQNIARFYRLEIQPTLFGDWSLNRIWGRVGTHGRGLRETYTTCRKAFEAARELERIKRRRGYVLMNGD